MLAESARPINRNLDRRIGFDAFLATQLALTLVSGTESYRISVKDLRL
jgi:hypothetical protein